MPGPGTFTSLQSKHVIIKPRLGHTGVAQQRPKAGPVYYGCTMEHYWPGLTLVSHLLSGILFPEKQGSFCGTFLFCALRQESLPIACVWTHTCVCACGVSVECVDVCIQAVSNKEQRPKAATPTLMLWSPRHGGWKKRASCSLDHCDLEPSVVDYHAVKNAPLVMFSGLLFFYTVPPGSHGATCWLGSLLMLLI
jgi:hypothetical protein